MDAYKNYALSFGMKDSAIPYPSDIIIFGEKKTSSLRVHMDFFQGAGNDIQEVKQKRHNFGGRGQSGVSNSAVVDGSAQSLRDGRSLFPVDLRAVTDAGRTNAALIQ